jgi:hypothetical protein
MLIYRIANIGNYWEFLLEKQIPLFFAEILQNYLLNNFITLVFY